ncbi:MAG TPA: WD40 repeat domain-containing protein, partial [Prosthecobacter sp.]
PAVAPGDLFLAVARALAEPLPELRPCPGGVERFARALEDGNHEAARILLETAYKSASDKIGGRLRLLLVVDQMEELWTERSITPEQREKFLQAIRALASCDPADSTQEGPISVLATLRSDFYPQAQLSADFLQMKDGRGHFDLTPPGPAALQQIIVQPARRAGLRFERNDRTGARLEERILKDASADPSALPLLQYALAELYERRDEEKRLLTFAAYEKMGGVEGALAKRAMQTLKGLPDDAQAALEELLPLLVSVDTAGEQKAVRRRAPMAELTSTPARRCLTKALIDKKARFLTTDEDKQTGSAIATLAHEALLRRWERVTKWINTNRDLLRMRARIEQQLAMWEQSGRDVSRLLASGSPLEEGRQLIESSTLVIDEKTKDYVLASAAHHAAAELRQNRTRRMVLAAVSALAVVAIIGAVMAYRGYYESSLNLDLAKQKTRDAEEANVKNLKDLHEASMADYAVAAQRIEKDGKWHEGVAHLVRSLKWEPENRLAAMRLYSTLSFHAAEKQNWPRQILPHDSSVYSAQFSADGTKIVTASGDMTAQVWD